MDYADELSPATRAGIIVVGALQGFICYLVTWYMAWASLPADTVWLMCVIPATVVVSTALSLSVTSFRQPVMWLVLLGMAAVVGGMGVWLKWRIQGMERWNVQDALTIFGIHLLLMSLLILPWLQRRLAVTSQDAFDVWFHDKNWLNVLTILLIFLSNGLFWLVLYLWAELFELIGIDAFHTLFFKTDWFIAVAIGVVSACTAVLARTQARRVQALQNLLTPIATGLLPLVAVLSLIFIAVLPFVGFEAISRRTSVAGLLVGLVLLLLVLVTVVWHPRRETLPYYSPLRSLVRVALLISPVYALLAVWALWLRIGQYGWSPERVCAALMTLIALVWASGFCISVIVRGRTTQRIRRSLAPAVGLLSLAILFLLNTPLLDPWRIGVASHMARYQEGKINAAQVSLYMLSHSGRKGREAMLTLQKDPTFIADAARKRALDGLLAGEKSKAQLVTAATLEKAIQLAPGMAPPDKAFWQAVMKYQYRLESCTYETGGCVLMAQDLNNDGSPEAVLYQFIDRGILVFTHSAGGWVLAGDTVDMPQGLTREDLNRAIQQGKVRAVVKPWADISLSGERIEMHYGRFDNPQ